MNTRVKYLIASCCLAIGLPATVSATPSSSANYVASGTSNQYHDYIFEQSNQVLMPSWKVYVTDNRIRSFPVRYGSFKHQPRWSEIYQDFGQRFGVAVLADMRKETLLVTWADEFKTPGLHYVQSNVKHERERFGWDSLLAAAKITELEYEHQRKLDMQKAEVERERKYNAELFAHKQQLTEDSAAKDRIRDRTLFQTIQNLEKDYELKRSRLESEYALKSLELAELKAIHKAHYKMDREALQEQFAQLVSKQNNEFAEKMINLQIQYQIDTQKLDEERKTISALQANLVSERHNYQKMFMEASISKDKYDSEIVKFNQSSKKLDADKTALAKRQKELEDNYNQRHAQIESEIVARTKSLNDEVVAMRDNLSQFKSEYKQSVDAEILAKSKELDQERNQLVQFKTDYKKEVQAEVNAQAEQLALQKAELAEQESELFSFKNKYYPDYQRQIDAGLAESNIKNFLKDEWKYDLLWDDSRAPIQYRGKISFSHGLKFTGQELESDLESMVCHLAQFTPQVVFTPMVYLRDRVVSIRVDTADSLTRNHFLQQCK